MSDRIRGKKDHTEVLVGSEIKETQESSQNSDATLTETLDLIPIEEIPAGKIEKTDKPEPTETTESEDTEKETVVDAGNNQEEKNEADKAADAAAKKPEYYIVKSGDTLTSISQNLYGTTDKIPEIVSLNQMENSDDIHVGQKLRLP